ncbi:MAG: sigma 54-interacting transcriptional regulator [Vicinamibacterales bacterium]
MLGRPGPVDASRQRALDLVGRGRHAAAVRLLREAAGACARRQRPGDAARLLVDLGRLLLERGRTRDGQRTLTEAGVSADAVGDARLQWEIALARAAALLDDLDPDAAETICRQLDPSTVPEALDACLRVVQVDILLVRGRLTSTVALEALQACDASRDAAWLDHGPALAHALVACGEAFAAGRLARRLTEYAAARGDARALSAAHVAHLHALTLCGDSVLAGEAFARAEASAFRARQVLHRAWARVWWIAMVRRLTGSAPAALMRAVGRVAKTGPARLRHAVQQTMGGTRAGRSLATAAAPADGLDPGLAGPGIAGPDAEVAGSLDRAVRGPASLELRIVRLVQEPSRDDTAVSGVLRALGEHFRLARVEVARTAAGGRVERVAQFGEGNPCERAVRVLLDEDAGGPDGAADDGGEIGVPIRLGRLMLGALAVRTHRPSDTSPLLRSSLKFAAAVVAPRLDGLLGDLHARTMTASLVPDLAGVSAAMDQVRASVARAAAAPFTVLVIGESGAGKEVVARAIHALGPRRHARFCDVNCAAIPDDLLEAELFGHVRGAFTGALIDRAGLFEEADGGTLFLDELPDLSRRGQAKLLRVLQQREVRRVGESGSRAIDVRIVAATNRDLGAEVDAGRFREDLMYRLDVIRIRIPPLRERLEDVPLLARRFWAASAEHAGTHAVLGQRVLGALTAYPWPGNVRELQNVMASLAVRAPVRGVVGPDLLPSTLHRAAAQPLPRLAEARAAFERGHLRAALAVASGNRARAARVLGVSRQGLLKAMARLDLQWSCNGDDQQEE